MKKYEVIVKSDDGKFEEIIGKELGQRQANKRFETAMNRYDMTRVHIVMKDDTGEYVTYPVGETE